VATIEVFADVWCPFTHVGLRAVLAMRDASGRDVIVRVRPWPLELVNGVPMEPAKAAANAAALRAQVAPDLFSSVDVDSFPTSTLEALALIEAAYRAAPSLGEQASVLVRDELFERGRDISDPVVLGALATRLGLRAPTEVDRDAVLSSLEEGRRRGVIGSPHFFCGLASSFCPSLEITRRDGALVVRADTSKLTAFIGRCLSGA
jgi:predicted DsbA family dithiol-disulfide isomerase